MICRGYTGRAQIAALQSSILVLCYTFCFSFIHYVTLRSERRTRTAARHGDLSTGPNGRWNSTASVLKIEYRPAFCFSRQATCASLNFVAIFVSSIQKYIYTYTMFSLVIQYVLSDFSSYTLCYYYTFSDWRHAGWPRRSH